MESGNLFACAEQCAAVTLIDLFRHPNLLVRTLTIGSEMFQNVTDYQVTLDND